MVLILTMLSHGFQWVLHSTYVACMQPSAVMSSISFSLNRLATFGIGEETMAQAGRPVISFMYWGMHPASRAAL